MRTFALICLASAAAGLPSVGEHAQIDPLATCPGYRASNVNRTWSSLTADLTLAGQPCNIYGYDLKDLVLEVTYETDKRLHVKIQDAENRVYQVPERVIPRPGPSGATEAESELTFEFKENPFSFSVIRTSSGEVLFDTSAASLVFESQYLRLRTKLPVEPHLYGLGDHSDPFRLKTTNYIRTLWAQDAYSVPEDSNLYGSHPVYYDHRASGTHGVFFLNSNGMDIKIDNSGSLGQYLEFNTLGGVLDFYFLAGPSPVEVARQYAETVGLPAMIPYWGLGFHNCRYGYQDVYDVAEAVQNYSSAGIPLETMWTDIDYMYLRRVFSLDPERFPLHMMRELVDHLHANDQHFILMVDPAVAHQDFPLTFQRGVESNVFLLDANDSPWKGVVWPGVTVFPDWFSENISTFWNNEFDVFFSPTHGVDIDGLWIDMNEPSNFRCNFPCDKPEDDAGAGPPTPPPVREPPRPLPGWSCAFQPPGTPCEPKANQHLELRTVGPEIMDQRPLVSVDSKPDQQGQIGLPDRDLLFPKYAIHNKAAYEDSWNSAEGGLSNRTVNTDVLHQNGLAVYDTHNLYGAMMSAQSREAMLARRPGLRPFIITRSTFAGSGSKVGHWLGDNLADWEHYRLAIRSVIASVAIYQMPIVGTDVCGFSTDTSEELCARWAALGAFAPFYRNHNDLGETAQEFYRWETVTQVAKKVIGIRYRLLDYMYTALYKQTVDGTPMMNPLFYLYPQDEKTWDLELQYFLGPGLLVAPVTEEHSTSVEVYLPDDVFYDFHTHEKVQGQADYLTIHNQTWMDIPLFLRGGVIIPLRAQSAMTTRDLRRQHFELLVPLDANGEATGELYLDDGESLVQNKTTMVSFSYSNHGLRAEGEFDYETGLKISKVIFLGYHDPNGKAKTASLTTQGRKTSIQTWHNAESLEVEVNIPLSGGFILSLNEQ